MVVDGDALGPEGSVLVGALCGVVLEADGGGPVERGLATARFTPPEPRPVRWNYLVITGGGRIAAVPGSDMAVLRRVAGSLRAR